MVPRAKAVKERVADSFHDRFPLAERTDRVTPRGSLIWDSNT